MGMTKRFLDDETVRLQNEAVSLLSAYSEDEQGAILFERFGAFDVIELDYYEVQDLVEFLQSKTEKAA